MAEGSSLSERVIKLVGYVQRLSALGFVIPMTLGMDILLASRPPSYNGFIMNYKMNGLDKTIDELFSMLKTAEASMQEDPDHVMVVSRDTRRGTVRSRPGHSVPPNRSVRYFVVLKFLVFR